MAKIKSQKVFGTKSYVCRSYKGKTGKGSLFAAPLLLTELKIYFSLISQTITNKGRNIF